MAHAEVSAPFRILLVEDSEHDAVAFHGCDRAIPNDMLRLWEAEPPWSVEVSLKRMGLLARGAFGEMVERANPHQSAYKEPRRDPSYANQGFVDNNI